MLKMIEAGNTLKEPNSLEKAYKVIKSKVRKATQMRTQYIQ